MSLRAELVRLGLRWFVKRKIGPATTLEALRRQDGEAWTMPATIDDPAILDEIGGALQARGLASSERGQAARQA
jgi:hypothetical protein